MVPNIKSSQNESRPLGLNGGMEDIVISGIAGRYPDSDSIDEFRDNLFKRHNFISEDDRRSPLGLWGLPGCLALIKDLGQFDNSFFGMSEREANDTEPHLRILLEVVYEAILDSGEIPSKLRGSRTGVFLGRCQNEFQLALGIAQFYERAITHHFDFRGPAMSTDTACGSSFTALLEAVIAIKNNRCDRAIVAGVATHVDPMSCIAFLRLNMLTKGNKDRVWDAKADGYIKSEGIVAILLERASSNTKRNYATIVNIKTNCDGYTPMGITYPSWKAQRDLMIETYQDCGVDPLRVKYVEAHATGTPAGDPEEARSIAAAMCNGRKEPLLCGLLKSCIGHGEAVSGLTALSKVIIASETGLIPPDQNFEKPHPTIEPYIRNGVLKNVGDKIVPLKGDLVAVNCFGFGGANIALIVKRNLKEKSESVGSQYSTVPQRLVFMNGRTREAVKHVFNKIAHDPKYRSNDFLSLLYEIAKAPPSCGMNCRGFALYDKGKMIASEVQENVPSKRPPIWYIFGGLGSQWPAMGNDITSIPIIQESLRKSYHILKPYGCDLISILMPKEEEAVNYCPLASFITIAAIQIALVDLLKYCNIQPNGIIGHSIGEVVCAYADECLTHEQALLAAMYRGVSVTHGNAPPKGMMAAVGMSWEEAKAQCPASIVPACHNAQDSVTIAGPEDKVKKFITRLKNKNIFAKEVNSCGVPFHSPQLEPIKAHLLRALTKVIPEPKRRSRRWISTSIPESEWKSNDSQLASASYFVNNLISPVLFHEALQKIPKNAVVIEISPHSLFQGILRRSVSPEVKYVGLMKKELSTNHINILSGLGRLYALGCDPKIGNFYPKVTYPVARGTPSISSLIKWKHEKPLFVPKYPDYFRTALSNDVTFEVDQDNAEDEFLLDHCMDGRVLFPGTGYLFLAWKKMAQSYQCKWHEIAVEFQDVEFFRATILPRTSGPNSIIKFTIRYDVMTGTFEIKEGGSLIATGRALPLYGGESHQRKSLEYQHWIDDPRFEFKDEDLILTKKDLYKDLRVRGLDYGPLFQATIRATMDGRRSDVIYTNKWISFVDGMLHLVHLNTTRRLLSLPTGIEMFRCDPKILHDTVGRLRQSQISKKVTSTSDDKRVEEGGESEVMMPVILDRDCRIAATYGIEMKALRMSLTQRQRFRPTVLEYVQYIPFNEIQAIDLEARDCLAKYNQLCDSLATYVSKKEKNLEKLDEMIKEFKEEHPSANCSQLDLLWKYVMQVDSHGDPKTVLTSLYKSRKESLCSDLFQSCANNERFLYPMLTIPMEQNISKRMRILELTMATEFLETYVKDVISRIDNKIEAEHTIAHPDPDAMSPDEVANDDVIKWSLATSKLPQGTSDHDMIIFNNSSVVSLIETALNKLNYGTFLESIHSGLKDEGFALLLMRDRLTPSEKLIYDSMVPESLRIRDLKAIVRMVVEHAKYLGFLVICTKTNSMSVNGILLRKRTTAKMSPPPYSVVKIRNDDYEWVEELKSKLKPQDEGDISTERKIWLISNNKQANGVLGLIKCLRKEPEGERLRCFLGEFANEADIDAIDNSEIFKQVLKADLVVNVVKNGHLGSYFSLPIPQEKINGLVSTPHAYISTAIRGNLSSFQWFEADHKHWPRGRRHGDRLIHIYYAPLNFRDIMMASGKLSPDSLPGEAGFQDCLIGFEYAGRDEEGKRVMGMNLCKALATDLVVEKSNSEFVIPIPDHLSMEEAATLPVVYATAYYALLVRGKLQHGESVLIHSGSGGVGQAAIRICLAMGCTVFTTVGSNEKKEFLKQLFPQLSDRNFANSRDLSFERHILRQTGGQGVDIVLNSLAGEKLQASIRILRNNGRYLEIGKYDLSINSKLDWPNMKSNRSFHGIFLDAFFDAEHRNGITIMNHERETFAHFKHGVATGVVQPLNRTIFTSDQVEDAFRFMASGKHIGKVMVKIREEEDIRGPVQTPELRVQAVPRTIFNSEKSYIIVGGLGGFGLELARWMVSRGATKIILNSRSGVTQPIQEYMIRSMTEAGVTVHISQDDSRQFEDARRMIAQAQELGPVGGILNLAMVLRDGLFENQTKEAFEQVTSAKFMSTANLDHLSRQMCPELDYFVCFSSIACGKGNAGQSNYGYANSLMEKICESRREAGYPAQAIQWGPIGDVGWIAENMGNEIVLGGTMPQRIPSCLETLDRLLLSPYIICGSCVPADPDADVGGQKGDILKTLANVIGVRDISDMDPNTSLSDMALDSLMAVEIKETLAREYGLNLNPEEVGKLTITKIRELGAKKVETGASPKKNQEEESQSLDMSQLKSIAGGDNLSRISSLLEQESELRIESIIERQFRIPSEPITNLAEDKCGRPIFYCPALYGSDELEQTIARRLKRPLHVVNWMEEYNICESIQEVASHQVEAILKSGDEWGIDRGIDILGYSFGGCLAFEIAIQLQKQGKKVTSLIMLDASPTIIKRWVQHMLRLIKFQDDSLVHAIVLVGAIGDFVKFEQQLKVQKELIQALDSNERNRQAAKILVDLIINEINSKSTQKQDISPTVYEWCLELVSRALNSYYIKRQIMHKYETRDKFQGDAILIRAEDSLFDKAEENVRISDDYGMQLVITGQCKVHRLPGDHKTFILHNVDEISQLLSFHVGGCLMIHKS